ncbi:MAG TPA: RNA-binding protein [Stellaceae bacterium]|nr:RNA-binding protein [Stellaceae bacterium]
MAAPAATAAIAPAPVGSGPDGGDAAAVERRCFVTGEVRPKAEMVRFVVDPAGRIVPDVTARLPGRGLWLTARRDIVERAVAKRLFARAARASVALDEGLADRIEALLAAQCCSLLGLARRAGQAVTGFVKVRSLVAAGGAAALVEASDGGVDARGKLEALAPGLPVVDRLTCAELSAALGHAHVVHAALVPGRLARSFLAEAARLGGFRAARTNFATGA